MIFSHGDDVVFKTRHDDDHKAWAPQPEHAIFFKGREQWNVYVAELLHSKTANVKNHLYLFDILVSDGEDLSGTSFADRQAILLGRYPGNGGAGLGATRVTRQVSRATCYTRDFERVWSELAAEDEGIVFKDPAALADLNAITHPLVGERMRELRETLGKTEHVVVFAIPLLRPVHRERLGFGAVVVVDCPIELAVERLVAGRGMDREDAMARIGAQISREERLAGADYVVDNSSSLEDLDAQVVRLWAWIGERRVSLRD